MKTENVTRVEVIDHTSGGTLDTRGRIFVYNNPKSTVELIFQDDNRTLKVFITDRKEPK